MRFTLGSVDLDERVSRIERGVAALLQRLDGVPVEALYTAPRAGEWPVMSNLAHVVEMLPYWAHQAEHIADHPGTSFGRTVDDPARLDAIEQHGGDQANVIRPALEASRGEAVLALRGLPESAWDTRGVHPLRGEMTVAQVVDGLMVHHVEEHVAQIDGALSALGYSPSQVP
jgi:hypothetical protein